MSKKLWTTKAWRDARAEFIVGKLCDWNPDHEGPLVLDHLTYLNVDGSHKTDAQIMDFKTSHSNGSLIVLCRKCAYARRYNKILCSVCGDSYHGPKMDTCFKCRMKEAPDRYVLCVDCGENHHDKTYDRCFPCNQKLKRSKSARKGWKTRKDQGRKK